MNKDRRYNHQSINAAALIFACLVAVLVMPAATGCGYDKSTFRVDQDKQPAVETARPALVQENLQELVTTGGGFSLPVRYATLSGDSEEKAVEVGVERPAACGDGSVEGVMASYTANTVSRLLEYPDAAGMTITMYGAKQGQAGDEIVVRLVVRRSTAEEIDWSMFGPMTMASLVDEYYINPRLQAIPGPR